MGATTSTRTKSPFQPKPRKATFTTETVKGERKFTPVNKRAKQAAILMGKKTAKLVVADLKTIKAAGMRVYEYTEDNKLKAISL